MLEKIGLPPKPAVRGNNWVADASHCQGCSSQFTFINRKHHCRRCGGLFCNSCTQQRMVLRGQGDSPVRICDPCKKLEEASRFEMRYGNKNRTGKGGGSKLTAKSEDEVLNQILGDEGTSSMSSSMSSLLSDQNPTNGAMQRSMSSDQQPTDVSTSVINTTPEELRQQAVEEKKKHRTLKAEGKPEEALRAFKRGKELEREAAALEISLRKNRRKALSVSTSSITEVSNVRNDTKVPSLENKHPPKKKEKDDLAAELRELGWSDMDLHDADEKKPKTITLEGELSKLLGEVNQGAKTENEARGAHGIDKSQVNAHKRKALELKRQGKLAEAKEELKKAKVLEKQIEEQELLGENENEEDSDEEFSSLLRSLNSGKHEDLSIGMDLNQGFDFGNIGGLGDDLGIDDDLEITHADMHDPDMLAALQSIGWTEEASAGDFEDQLEDAAPEALANEIQSLKKEALKQKRAGNNKEALALFRKAKLLESASVKTDDSMIPSESLEVDIGVVHERKNPSQSKSKSAIQRELLGLKKRALALRREGKLTEAEEELNKGKALEKQLEELENAPKVRPPVSQDKQIDDIVVPDVEDEDVTDQDLTDPSYLAVLQSLGWNEDANESHPPPSSSVHANVQAGVSKKSKGEIQRELLGLKRKLLVLRRQGETEEAEEILKKAEVLESQLADMEAPKQKELKKAEVLEPQLAEMEAPKQKEVPAEPSKDKEHDAQSPLVDLSDAGFTTPERKKQIIHQEIQSISESQQNDAPSPPLQQEILTHKRKALALKREGKLAEAKEELRKAKLLEKCLEESKSPSPSQDNESQPSPSDLSASPDVSHDVCKKDSSPDSVPKTLSSRERFKLQQESLSHKRQALKLRREGRTDEADAEFEKAKAIEAQLEESSPQKVAEPADDVGVEDFLDPQLFSALKAIGLDNLGSGSSQIPEKRELEKQVEVKIDGGSSDERVVLENQIKAEKVKALNFKRSGKQADALDALRKARVLEKKLNSLVK